MLAPVLASVIVAATPRLITELDNRLEAGLFPNFGPAPGVSDPGEIAEFGEGSTSLMQWTIVPSVTGRLDLRVHRFGVRYNPQILVQAPAEEGQIEAGPIVFHRTSADYEWLFTRGGALSSAVAFETGDTPANLFARGPERDPDEAPGFVPPAAILTYDRIAYSGQLRLDTGSVESFTLRFGAGYNRPRGETEGALLSTYQLDVGIGYERFVFHQTWLVLSTQMQHFDFYVENRQARSAGLQAGLRRVESRTWEWSLTAGLQANVGDRTGADADPDAPRTIGEILPAGQLLMEWTFLRNASAVASLTWDAGVRGTIDRAAGLYIPLTYTTLGFNLVQPWGSFNADARGTIPIVSADQIQGSNLPTSYAVSAELNLPASAYVNFFFGGRVAQRAPPIDVEDFRFGFLEAIARVGMRLRWSTGRDARLPRPSQTLGGEGESG